MRSATIGETSLNTARPPRRRAPPCRGTPRTERAHCTTINPPGLRVGRRHFGLLTGTYAAPGGGVNRASAPPSGGGRPVSGPLAVLGGRCAQGEICPRRSSGAGGRDERSHLAGVLHS